MPANRFYEEIEASIFFLREPCVINPFVAIDISKDRFITINQTKTFIFQNQNQIIRPLIILHRYVSQTTDNFQPKHATQRKG